MQKENNLAQYYFHQGTNFHAYDYLGCTLTKKDGKNVYTFRVWAPNADSVAFLSDINGWDEPLYMEKLTDRGIFECSIESECSLDGTPYKFRIQNGDKFLLKADPYARFSRGGADGASLIYTETNHVWTDAEWLKFRKKRLKDKSGSYLPKPINIYEVHFGSFCRHKEDNRYYSYREMADVLVPYLKYMGYTHVEFLPLAEHPFDGSWGYQVCGFYAPSSRFGTPDDFKYLVNKLHENGIGIILDWVPAHFPKDAWGLYEFDGEPLYEYQGKDRKESETWGTRFFDLGREEVQSFLVSNALYFLREFHIDGLRVDAVASMLYLDYDKRPGEWIPNENGGRENLEAIAFFKKLNSAIFNEFPEALMIAEESDSYPNITRPVSDGGLGFNLKWNMGWANDFYDYVMTDPAFRKYKHKALNFPLMYAFRENYVMPISHDEVVHGKLSFINKMYGSYEDKFKQGRESLILMMTYPGKKLLFMGTEFAQFREWDYENSLEWFMLDYPKHKEYREFVAALNRFYLDTPELWEMDFVPEGFEWICADEEDKNLVAYRRFDRKGNSVTVIINFSGTEQTVTLKSKKAKYLTPLFESEPVFSGTEIKFGKADGENYLNLSIPAFYGAIFKEKNSNIKIKIKEK